MEETRDSELEGSSGTQPGQELWGMPGWNRLGTSMAYSGAHPTGDLGGLGVLQAAWETQYGVPQAGWLQQGQYGVPQTNWLQQGQYGMLQADWLQQEQFGMALGSAIGVPMYRVPTIPEEEEGEEMQEEEEVGGSRDEVRVEGKRGGGVVKEEEEEEREEEKGRFDWTDDEEVGAPTTQRETVSGLLQGPGLSTANLSDSLEVHHSMEVRHSQERERAENAALLQAELLRVLAHSAAPTPPLAPAPTLAPTPTLTPTHTLAPTPTLAPAPSPAPSPASVLAHSHSPVSGQPAAFSSPFQPRAPAAGTPLHPESPRGHATATHSSGAHTVASPGLSSSRSPALAPTPAPAFAPAQSPAQSLEPTPGTDARVPSALAGPAESEPSVRGGGESETTREGEGLGETSEGVTSNKGGDEEDDGVGSNEGEEEDDDGVGSNDSFDQWQTELGMAQQFWALPAGKGPATAGKAGQEPGHKEDQTSSNMTDKAESATEGGLSAVEGSSSGPVHPGWLAMAAGEGEGEGDGAREGEAGKGEQSSSEEWSEGEEVRKGASGSASGYDVVSGRSGSSGAAAKIQGALSRQAESYWADHEGGSDSSGGSASAGLRRSREVLSPEEQRRSQEGLSAEELRRKEGEGGTKTWSAPTTPRLSGVADRLSGSAASPTQSSRPAAASLPSTPRVCATPLPPSLTSPVSPHVRPTTTPSLTPTPAPTTTPTLTPTLTPTVTSTLPGTPSLPGTPLAPSPQDSPGQNKVRTSRSRTGAGESGDAGQGAVEGRTDGERRSGDESLGAGGAPAVKAALVPAPVPVPVSAAASCAASSECGTEPVAFGASRSGESAVTSSTLDTSEDITSSDEDDTDNDPSSLLLSHWLTEPLARNLFPRHNTPQASPGHTGSPPQGQATDAPTASPGTDSSPLPQVPVHRRPASTAEGEGAPGAQQFTRAHSLGDEPETGSSDGNGAPGMSRGYQGSAAGSVSGSGGGSSLGRNRSQSDGECTTRRRKKGGASASSSGSGGKASKSRGPRRMWEMEWDLLPDTTPGVPQGNPEQGALAPPGVPRARSQDQAEGETALSAAQNSIVFNGGVLPLAPTIASNSTVPTHGRFQPPVSFQDAGGVPTQGAWDASGVASAMGLWDASNGVPMQGMWDAGGVPPPSGRAWGLDASGVPAQMGGVPHWDSLNGAPSQMAGWDASGVPGAHVGGMSAREAQAQGMSDSETSGAQSGGEAGGVPRDFSTQGGPGAAGGEGVVPEGCLTWLTIGHGPFSDADSIPVLSLDGRMRKLAAMRNELERLVRDWNRHTSTPQAAGIPQPLGTEPPSDSDSLGGGPGMPSASAAVGVPGAVGDGSGKWKWSGELTATGLRERGGESGEDDSDVPYHSDIPTTSEDEGGSGSSHPRRTRGAPKLLGSFLGSRRGGGSPRYTREGQGAGAGGGAKARRASQKALNGLKASLGSAMKGFASSLASSSSLRDPTGAPAGTPQYDASNLDRYSWPTEDGSAESTPPPSGPLGGVPAVNGLPGAGGAPGGAAGAPVVYQGDDGAAVTKVLVVPLEQADTLVAMHGSVALCTLGPGIEEYAAPTGDAAYDAFVDQVIGLVSEFYLSSFRPHVAA